MRRSAILLAVLLLVAGCGTAPSGDRASTREEPLIVFAASDLQGALGDVATAFAAAGHPAPTISFGSTGTLSRQIENGAPADVFFAADESYIAELERRDLVAGGTRELYAIGRIVLVERAGLPPVTALGDLARLDIARIAIANPDHAPYGRAARDALMRSGVWASAHPRLVLGENISQTFQFVQTGNADVGIVALSIVLGASGARWSLIDASLHDPIAQAAAVIARTRQPDAARAFLAFVNGPTGRPIMKRYGFALPGES